MTTERIEAVLADFRRWLSMLETPPTPVTANANVDLFTLVGQFSALRQEVNMQTRATRSALEQNAGVLEKLEQLSEALNEQPETEVEKTWSSDELRSLLKSIVDVYDALAIAGKQLIKQRELLSKMLDELVAQVSESLPPLPETTLQPIVRDVHVNPERSGVWKRLFGSQPASVDVSIATTELLVEREKLHRWREKAIARSAGVNEQVRALGQRLRDSLDGLITGYTMSLKRIERVLPQYGLEPLPCEGESFDPETMEVVEVVADSGRSPGEIIEEVRRGYYWNGKLFRYAQVRVAR